MAILPVVTYDDPVLREKTEEIKELTPEIKTLIEDMFETMYNADGVGLAAPQIGKAIRLFVIDPDPVSEERDGETFGKMAFINPVITNKFGDEVEYQEGCLSLPDLYDNVIRPDGIDIEYYDENFEKQSLTAEGFLSRVIQHEFDHLEGVLFFDYLSAFRKRMIRKKLDKIAAGNQKAHYPLRPKTNESEAE